MVLIEEMNQFVHLMPPDLAIWIKYCFFQELKVSQELNFLERNPGIESGFGIAITLGFSPTNEIWRNNHRYISYRMIFVLFVAFCSPPSA